MADQINITTQAFNRLVDFLRTSSDYEKANLLMTVVKRHPELVADCIEPVLDDTLIALCRERQKIQAIKLLREYRRDFGLKEAKDYVDALCSRHNIY